MLHYIVLLRGVNMGKYNQVPMKALGSLLSAAGFLQVRTYIQSGNVVCAHPVQLPEEISASITGLLKESFGHHIPALVYSPAYLRQVLDENPFLSEETAEKDKLYFIFLENDPDPARVEKLSQTDFSPERYVIKGKLIYLYCPSGYGQSKLNNNFFESKLKVTATTRNLNTVRELIRMSGDGE